VKKELTAFWYASCISFCLIGSAVSVERFEMIRHMVTSLILLCSCCLADLQLPTIFSDHMVLQRDKPVPVWGVADAGAAVTVELAGHKKQTVADAEGNWRVMLDTMSASSEPRSMTIHSSNSPPIQYSDLLVG
jgi:sialate O-acetylesterase